MSWQIYRASPYTAIGTRMTRAKRGDQTITDKPHAA